MFLETRFWHQKPFFRARNYFWDQKTTFWPNNQFSTISRHFLTPNANSPPPPATPTKNASTCPDRTPASQWHGASKKNKLFATTFTIRERKSVPASKATNSADNLTLAHQKLATIKSICSRLFWWIERTMWSVLKGVFRLTTCVTRLRKRRWSTAPRVISVGRSMMAGFWRGLMIGRFGGYSVVERGEKFCVFWTE